MVVATASCRILFSTSLSVSAQEFAKLPKMITSYRVLHILAIKTLKKFIVQLHILEDLSIINIIIFQSCHLLSIGMNNFIGLLVISSAT